MEGSIIWILAAFVIYLLFMIVIGKIGRASCRERVYVMV